MILVFDLDDTLYDEMSFVQSGFAAVSTLLNNEFNIGKSESYEMMLDVLDKEGRGEIFNRILENFGIFSKKRVRKCLSTYRSHKPQINLPKTSIKLLKRFDDYPKYIVTDGNKYVQKQKITTLNLYQKIKKAFITHCYGLKHAKPSPYCLEKIARIEKCPNSCIVYIGDDPHKDFVGIKPMGFKTIRVLQGRHKNTKLDKGREAHLSVSSLDDITKKLVNCMLH